MNSARLYRKFFEKTGIQLTDEPVSDACGNAGIDAERLHYLAQNNPRRAVRELEPLVAQHPNIPALKNYLYVAYILSKNIGKGELLLDRTLEDHPGYIFGISNKIMRLKDKESLEKHAYLLGETRDIRSIIKEDRPIHITEFVSYEQAAIHYEARTGQEKQAIARLDNLLELDIPEAKIEEIVAMLGRLRLANKLEWMEKMETARINVESFPTVDIVQSKEPPILQHKELEIFYERKVNLPHRTYKDAISEAEIASIYALPRETLIQDVETVLEDAIRRFDYLQDEGYHEYIYSFLYHALHFSGALKSESSLQKVLDLLRMGEDFTEFWFGDMRKDLLFYPLYQLAEKQLGVLKDFVLEENNGAYDRMLASEVASQIALHHPERRTEVIQWFDDVFGYILESPSKGLLDTDFISFSVGYVIDFRGVELLPIIEKMYEQGWIPKNIQGDLKEITRLMNLSSHDSDIEPLPQNIQEYYSFAYLKRKAAKPPIEERLGFDPFAPKSEAEEMVSSYAMREMFGGVLGKNKATGALNTGALNKSYEPRTGGQLVRKTKKIGRNEPCPCGSGKKYKRCCLKKK